MKNRKLVSTGYHLPYNPCLTEQARSLRKNPTDAEKVLWQTFLKKFKFRVLRQRPIDNFIVDFYCPKLKLVIEIDGAAHFKEEGRWADQERTKILEAYGVPKAVATSYTFVLHIALWLPITALGAYYLAREGIRWGEVPSEGDKAVA